VGGGGGVKPAGRTSRSCWWECVLSTGVTLNLFVRNCSLFRTLMQVIPTCTYRRIGLSPSRRYTELKPGAPSREEKSLHATRSSSFTIVPHQARKNIRSCKLKPWALVDCFTGLCPLFEVWGLGGWRAQCTRRSRPDLETEFRALRAWAFLRV